MHIDLWFLLFTFTLLLFIMCCIAMFVFSIFLFICLKAIWKILTLLLLLLLFKNYLTLLLIGKFYYINNNFCMSLYFLYKKYI